ncbi:hypothetical protein BJY01DRAFT_261398 [Aspergillus pseudoustus]|uniref:NACHT domain-containing protein n=1 Tax=Aspergillus pseudoustus TaxID=1810923 RepID=A0ABR4IMR2_9EURO
MAKRRLPRDAYTVACVCALPLELAAVKFMIDEPHDPLDSQPGSDDNIYTLGSIGRHNVVFLCLPHGVYGTTSAATAVAGLRSTFTRIRFGLMVGIGGGAPTSMADVRLGDVVVSKPTGAFGGVIQYDLGKALSNGSFERTGSLSKPPPILLKAISELDSDPITTIKQLSKSIQSALEREGAAQEDSRFQRPPHDWLFLSSYKHEADHPDCSDCDRRQLVKRSERPSNEPVVHYGLIASGNQVIKDSKTRDRVACDLGVICFEMEAAGIIDQCPSLVIRGICDYCDSHKNKQWQGYAALAAAAYAKQVLRELQCLRSLSRTDADDHKNSLKRRKGKRVSSTCSWFLDTEEMTDWLGQASQTTGCPEKRNILWLHGNPGTGKSTMAITLVEELPQMPSFTHGDSVLAYFFCDTGTEDNRTAISILGSLLQQVIWQRPRFMEHLMQKYSRRGNQLFSSFDGLWAVLMDISHNSGDTKIFCIVDALDECFEESQRTLLRQIDQEFRSGHANHVNPESLHLLITSRPYPEISQYLSSFYNKDLASYPAVADDLSKVIGEKVKELAMQKKYTAEVTAQVKQILEEKAEGTFLWVGIACNELEDIPSRKAVATLQKLPRAIEMNKDDEQLIIRMLTFLIIAREPPTVPGLSKACELFVNESELNRLQFTQEVIGLCRLMIVIDGGLVRLLHKSVKDFLIKDSGKLDELEANSTLAYRCIDYFISRKEEPGAADTIFSFPPITPEQQLVARTRNDWFFNYSVRYWPEHASLAQDRFTVRQNHRKFFCLRSEAWGAWCYCYNHLFFYKKEDLEYAYKGFSIMHAAARWAIAPLIAFGLESSKASCPSEREIFVDENFKAPGGETPLEEAARRGQTTAMALLLRKSPIGQSIGSNVFCW